MRMMKLSRNTVRTIVVLIVVAVVGLMILQYALLRNTIELRDQTFKRNVFAALNNALDKLEDSLLRDAVVPAAQLTTDAPVLAVGAGRCAGNFEC